MEKRWVYQQGSDPTTAQMLAEAIRIRPFIADLLIRRGISEYHAAKSWFNPSEDQMHDPFYMKGMKEAVERLENAIRNDERILIYGDYDVDGTTAVSLVYGFLSSRYPNVSYYIPDRYKEGYGLSAEGIQYAADNAFDLIITLDCGIKAIDRIAAGREKGLDFIVCDHHLPGENLPDAVVLDPKQKGCDYPYKELTGCGIGFKLIQALSMSDPGVHPREIYDFLDLVALSIGADIVPVTGENRVLASIGLSMLNRSPRPGIRALLRLAKKQLPMTIEDLVFIVAPRINAAGRMDSASLAVELFLASDEDTAMEYAKYLEDLNLDRKTLDKETTEEALEQIRKDPFLQTSNSSLVFSETWHKGVIGIVASRLTETYYRPTVVLTSVNGVATGSVRSVQGFNVYEALEACEDVLTQFGGHDFAAGLTLPVDQIKLFRERFEEEVNRRLGEEHKTPVLEIEEDLPLADANESLYGIIQRMEPFGPGNMKPVFSSRNVLDAGGTRAVGSDGAHLKLEITQAGYNGKPIQGIGFGLGHLAEEISGGMPFHVAYTLDENHWNGRTTLQLNVKDIRMDTGVENHAQ